jgi:hypothetical protein
MNVTVVYSKVLSHHFLGGTLINYKNCEDTHPLNQEFKHEPLKYEALDYDIWYSTLKRIQKSSPLSSRSLTSASDR